MKKQILAAAIAAVMAAPSAFAAQDTSGMHYTSAAEGFYASLRARYHSGGEESVRPGIQDSASRIGVRGTNDLGGGMEGFYQYEAGVGLVNGDALSTRLSHVGLRGAFGQLQAGIFWPQQYNWLTGTTDVANVHSGNLLGTVLYPAIQSRAVEFTTPDINGFQAAFLVEMDKDRDGEGEGTLKGKEEVRGEFDANRDGEIDRSNTSETNAVLEPAALALSETDDNGIDLYILAAKYSHQEIDFAASWAVSPDGISKDGTAGNRTDLTAWTIHGGYAEDNWYLNAWYSRNNRGNEGYLGINRTGCDTGLRCDRGAGRYDDDEELFSIAAGFAVGRADVYAVYEKKEHSALVPNPFDINEQVSYDDVYGALGIQYTLTARSRVWIEYAAQDLDSKPEAEDFITIGLRHDF